MITNEPEPQEETLPNIFKSPDLPDWVRDVIKIDVLDDDVAATSETTGED